MAIDKTFINVCTYHIINWYASGTNKLQVSIKDTIVGSILILLIFKEHKSGKFECWAEDKYGRKGWYSCLDKFFL